VRFACEDALAHAITGVRAILDELERARGRIWPEGAGPQGIR
jgi:hypothetical protein